MNPSLKVTASTTALVLMDYQNLVVTMLPSEIDKEALLANAVAARECARAAGAVVAHVYVAFTPDEYDRIPDENKAFAAMKTARYATEDTEPVRIHAKLTPAADEIVVRKTRYGAMSTTDLAEQLRARGVTTLVLAGVATSGVVLSTVRDAADKDFRLFVLRDCCADRDAEVHRVLLDKVIPRQADVIDVATFKTLL